MAWYAMADEKLELLLNAALAATQGEREASDILEVGFDKEDQTWEVIVKYHGDLLFLDELSITAERLLAGYAILTVPEDKLTLLSEMEEIEYVEKPKSLYFQIQRGIQASCILPVTLRPPYLGGEGVLLGIADSGIDYRHPAFLRADGTTRIAAIWDQSLMPDAAIGWQPPDGFAGGVEFSQEQINAALRPESVSLPIRDVSGHGTAAAGIAAGAAPESELLIVKLGEPREGGFPRTSELMRAVTYMVKKAVSLGRPIAVNLSFGNTYGSHDGTSLLERFLDNASEVGRSVICVGSGNEGAAMGHVSGSLSAEGSFAGRNGADSLSGTAAGGISGTAAGGISGRMADGSFDGRGGTGGIPDRTAALVELQVGNYQSAFSVQLWKNYADTFEITLRSPGGREQRFSTEVTGEEGMRRILLEETEVLLYVGEPTPYSAKQEIYLDFLPMQTERNNNSYVNRGVWSFLLEPVRIVTGDYSFYLPSQTAVGTETRFYRPTPDVTLTIPSTAARVITVGAYDAAYDAYADFSGRGYVFAARAGERLGSSQNKPDLVAPGVGIVTAMAGGGYRAVTGTSFAVPFVTAASALLMEWGDGVIVRSKWTSI